MADQERNPLEHVLSDAERERVFDLLLRLEIGEPREAPLPTLRYVGGQPGAGKSSLQQRVIAGLEKADGPHSALEINNDRYRVHHPRYEELRARDEETASFYTNEDCNYWIERALQVALERKPHILLESSLRRPEEVLATLSRGREHGFATALDLVVCHEFESRLSIAQRYLGMIDQHGAGRYVLRATHDESYRKLADVLPTLASPDAGFETITLHSRDGQALHRHDRDDDPRELQATYRRLRDTPRTSRDHLLHTVDQQIAKAEHYDRPACLQDLLALRADIERQR